MLIALGALTPSITGLLNRWGVTTAFYAGEFLGVLRPQGDRGLWQPYRVFPPDVS